MAEPDDASKELIDGAITVIVANLEMLRTLWVTPILRSPPSVEIVILS